MIEPIPINTSANESLIFSHMREGNLNALKKEKVMFVFSPILNPTLDLKYSNKYLELAECDHYEQYNLDTIVDACINEDNSQFPPKISTYLTLNLAICNDTTMHDLFAQLIDKLSEYANKHNTLIILSTQIPIYYGYNNLRGMPTVIMDVSIMQYYIDIYARTQKQALIDAKKRLDSFKILSNVVPKHLYLDTSRFHGKLYHFSRNSKLTTLIPTVTGKSMDDENIGIHRISAAPTIDGCFRGIGINVASIPYNESINYYGYQIILNKDTRVIRPTARMVPDVGFTDEYWILDGVNVKPIGYIGVSRSTIDPTKLVFDDSHITVKQ